ncbi:MAG: acetyl-CoA C-acyltransferase [Planctomycetaceae bacterium]|nr:acetyl-CoA C-acyltransferase [Planctomycetaceae bacterium]
MNEAWILAGSRTPIGRFLGAFSDLSAPALGGIVIAESLTRAGIAKEAVDEVIMGNVLSAGVGQAPARQAALCAGLPDTVAALTINKVCGSGLKAVMLAAQVVRLSEADVVVAGGMENMSRAPRLLRGSRSGWKLGDVPLEDALLRDGLWCSFDDCHMGMHAEYTARTHDVSRTDQDAYAFESQQRAGKAIEADAFGDEIVPVSVGETTHASDEGPRPNTELSRLAKLAPAFDANGSVTAGNASMLSDGAAAVVVTNRRLADSSDARWKARILASHTSGGPPRELFTAPVAAIREAVEKAGLSLEEIDLFEINEAFAAQSVACLRLLELDGERVNVHGGAIALGHPIGASGARILVTLLAALEQRNGRYGVAGLCLGGGNAVAMVVERVRD